MRAYKKLFLSTIFTLSCYVAVGQNYSGTVYDDSGESMSYVNIGVVGKNVGTASGIGGEYSLDIAPEFDNDTICFSYLGYKSVSMTVAEFRKNSKDIVLIPHAVEIASIVVRPIKTKEVRLGKKYRNNSVLIGFSEGVDRGNEIGVIYKIKKRTFLKTVVVQINENSCDTLNTRLNIYQKDGDSWKHINIKPIYVKIKPNQVGDLRIDLSKVCEEEIVVEDDIMVSLECIEDIDEGDIYFKGGLFGTKTLVRETSQGDWEKIPLGIGVGIHVEALREK